jgi:hypothetical protein
MVEAYSKAFLLTGPNVQFLRHMIDRNGLDELARRTMASEWAEDFSKSMGQYYRYDGDYAAPLVAAVEAAGRWPWYSQHVST